MTAEGTSQISNKDDKSEIARVLREIGESLEDKHYFALQRTRYSWLLTEILKRVPRGSSIADVGAAPGHMSMALKQLGYSVTAFDFAPDASMWESTNETFAQTLGKLGIAVEKFDVEVTDPKSVPSGPLETGRFDAAIFTEILEHIYHYPFASVRKVANLLKSDGLLFVTTPNRGYAAWRLSFLFAKSVDTSVDLLGDHFPPHMRHVWLYTPEEVARILGEGGLDVILCNVRSFHLWTTTVGPREVLDYWKPNSVKSILKLPLALMLTFAPSLGSTVCAIAKRSTR